MDFDKLVVRGNDCLQLNGSLNSQCLEQITPICGPYLEADIRHLKLFKRLSTGNAFGLNGTLIGQRLQRLAFLTARGSALVCLPT